MGTRVLRSFDIWKLVSTIAISAAACAPPADDTVSDQSVASVSQAVSGTVSLGIAAGNSHVCAMVSGGIQCWGSNGLGQLGNSLSGGSSFARVAVSNVSTGIQSIAGGSSHTCAVVNGGAMCWGDNLHGQLGNENNPPHPDPNLSPAPIAVTGLGAGVQAIAAGNFHTCAIVSGAARCWGYNANGQLGVPTPTETNAVVQVGNLTSGVTDITTGGSHSCAIVNGIAKCWGLNDHGQLGNGVAGNRADPVQVTELPSGVQAISAGLLHTCALVSGGVRCWGSNQSGQLGSDSSSDSNKPVPVTGLTSGVQAISAGASHTCALLTSGTVQCWGSNQSGELGTGTTSEVPSRPVSVVGLPNGARAIVTGARFSCATVNDGVWCWGANGNGQLAFNPHDSLVSPSPVQVGGLGVAAGCADGTVEQTFGGGMVGCAGSVTFANRATLCAPGYAPATAVQWMSNRGNAKPGHNYWTNEPLLRSGAGPSACFAAPGGGNGCGATPMRVCTTTGSDSEGNTCAWTQCGLYANAPNQFFGGCNDNSFAGTVCIPSIAPQVGCALQSCPKWENGVSTSTNSEDTGILGTVRNCSQFCPSAGHCRTRTCSGTPSEPTAACQSAASARLTALRSDIQGRVALETSFDSAQALLQGSANAQAAANVTTSYGLRSDFTEQCGDVGGGNEDPPCTLFWAERLECVLQVTTPAPAIARNDACGCQ